MGSDSRSRITTYEASGACHASYVKYTFWARLASGNTRHPPGWPRMSWFVARGPLKGAGEPHGLRHQRLQTSLVSRGAFDDRRGAPPPAGGPGPRPRGRLRPGKRAAAYPVKPGCNWLTGRKIRRGMEPRARVELATCRLRIGCSTTELPRLRSHKHWRYRITTALLLYNLHQTCIVSDGLLHGVLYILYVHDVVAVKDRKRFVPSDFHRNLVVHTRTFEIPDRTAT